MGCTHGVPGRVAPHYNLSPSAKGGGAAAKAVDAPEKCEPASAHTIVPAASPAAVPADVAAAGHAAMTAYAPAGVRHTRVLWDIENVAIPAGVEPFQLVCTLEAWLVQRSLWGAGVDGLISCFCNPDALARTHRHALDRAGVEQVRTRIARARGINSQL